MGFPGLTVRPSIHEHGIRYIDMTKSTIIIYKYIGHARESMDFKEKERIAKSSSRQILEEHALWYRMRSDHLCVCVCGGGDIIPNIQTEMWICEITESV